MNLVNIWTAVALFLGAAGAVQAQPQITQCMTFDGWWYTDIYFEPTASRVLSHNLERFWQLTEIAANVQPHPCCPRLSWSVSAHTDRAEVAVKAQAILAAARMDYAVELLVEAGVPRPDICTKSYGNSQPIAQPPDSKNARVEIHLQCETEKKFLERVMNSGLIFPEESPSSRDEQKALPH